MPFPSPSIRLLALMASCHVPEISLHMSESLRRHTRSIKLRHVFLASYFSRFSAPENHKNDDPSHVDWP